MTTTVPRWILCLVAAFLCCTDIEATGFWNVNNNNKATSCERPCVPGDESIMRQKAHGTSDVPVQSDLRWGCSEITADRICNYNRKYAEYSGYWETTSFLSQVAPLMEKKEPAKFFDSNTGKLLFTAPLGRSWEDFIEESRRHGWPSFRDEEVNWDVVRVLPDGETVSTAGTHLGHNLPDRSGNRFCINIVSVCGRPVN